MTALSNAIDVSKAFFPDTPEKVIRSCFAAARDLMIDSEKSTEGHHAQCECETCDWLHPSPFYWLDHGTTTTYTYHQCRCGRCRKAIRHYNRERREGR